MQRIILKLFGWWTTLLPGDPAVVDRWRWLAAHVRAGPLRTLDAGCGSGAFSLYAARQGNEVVGISFDDRNNRTATERAGMLEFTNVRFITGDLRALDTLHSSLGMFHQVFCFETIEHIKGDAKLLGDIASVLVAGGQLLLSAPFEHYRRLPGDNISDVENGGHVRWGYTHARLTELCAGAGLHIEYAGYVSGVVTQCLIRTERILGWCMPYRLAWALVFPFRIFQLIDRPLTDLIRYPYLSVAIVARKV